MKIRSYWQPLLVSLFCILPFLAQFAQADNSQLREKTIAWVRSNIDFSAEMSDNLTRQIEDAFKKDQDILISTDGDNTKNRKSMLLSTWQGELFANPLTYNQAKSLGLYAGILNFQSMGKLPADKTRMDKPIFTVSDIQFGGGEKIAGDKPIAGQFKLKQSGNNPAQKTLVQIKWLQEDRSRTENLKINTIPSDGVIPFTIDPIFTETEAPVFGPTLIYVQILVEAADSPATIASNSIATIVDLAPSSESIVRYSLKLSEEMIAILEKVQDRESAKNAIAEYTKVAVRNQSVATSLDRLGVVNPMDDKNLEAKYGERFTQVTQRLQALVARLEKAEYAGNRFFDDLQASVQKALKESK